MNPDCKKCKKESCIEQDDNGKCHKSTCEQAGDRDDSICHGSCQPPDIGEKEECPKCDGHGELFVCGKNEAKMGEILDGDPNEPMRIVPCPACQRPQGDAIIGDHGKCANV